MSVIGSNIIAGASGTVETGYQISRSLRFNSADSTYLSRTPASTGNRQKWTYSFWIKRSAVSGATARTVLSADSGSGTSNYSDFYFNDNGGAVFICDFGPDASRVQCTTTAVFRDAGAWMHGVIAVDTTQATAANRVKVYFNNVLFSLSGYPSQNYNTDVNTTIAHAIGRRGGVTPDQYLDGYMADIRLIDGQQLDPTNFGETDSATGVWVPKAYTGTYGTNGFWLKFDDNSGTTSTTLGKDSSGNSNNWTPNNFSVTAGVGNDSLVDSPTNYGTDTGAGGEVRGNYATMNPLDMGSQVSLANGNLDVSWSNTAGHSVRATTGITTGKWYWEVVAGGNCSIGIIRGDLRIVPATGSLWPGADGFGAGGSYAYAQDGRAVTNSVYSTYGASFASGDVIGVAFDADNGRIFFAKNGTWQNSGNPASGTNPAYSSIASNTWMPAIGYWGGTAGTVNSFNFGQRPFAYTAPSGFKALCTQNLPTPTIGTSSTTLADDYFNIALYTGNGTAIGSGGKAVTGLGFQPDFVWIKGRSGATDHSLFDAIRGTTKLLESNTTDAESTQSESLTTFGSDGFTVGSLAQVNTNTATYVGWAWKANGAGVSNTAGSINSTVSVNTTAGISVVAWTDPTSGTSYTIGHGLGATPAMIIFKYRAQVSNWLVYHKSIASGSYCYLNTTAAATAISGAVSALSSTTITLGTYYVDNPAQNLIAYCFAEVEGFSKFGSYTGNGSADGPFVYCGFRPRFILSKRTDAGTNFWYITDTARNTYNVVDLALYPNNSNVEGSYAAFDILSNGFKVRNTSTDINGSSATYIFAAFAEAPFNYARAR